MFVSKKNQLKVKKKTIYKVHTYAQCYIFLRLFQPILKVYLVIFGPNFSEYFNAKNGRKKMEEKNCEIAHVNFIKISRFQINF